MSILRSLLTVLATSALTIPVAHAAPNDLCVRQAWSVPGQAVAHPQWWNPGLSASQREVRWTEATSRTSGDGATPSLVTTRSIWDRASHTVFYEFTVNGDPSLDGLQDLVVMAVSSVDGNSPELFIQFQPLRGCSSLRNCSNLGSAITPAAVTYSQAVSTPTSTSWTPLSSTPPASTPFVVEHPWVQVRPVSSGGTTTYNWTLKFALQVPTGVDGEIRPNLRTYANAVMYMPGPTSGTAVEFPVLCNPSSPTSNDCMMFTGGSGTQITDGLPLGNMANSWPVLESSDPSTCEGVEVYRSLVGSDYNTTIGTVPGTATPYELPGFEIPLNRGARLRAGFRNNSSQPLAAGDITADFYLADWGLQYPEWGDATWSYIANATLNAPVAAGGYAGALGQGRIQSDVWVPATSGLELENSHQCMYVRLRSNTPGVKFTLDSVYRNMDIVNASVARRPADIDLGNRKLPKGHKAHKVYLLTRSENMPDPQKCKDSRNKAYGCAKGGALTLEQKALSSKEKKLLTKDFKAGRTELSNEQFQALLKRKKRKGKKAEELPFYVVYGMVDTGKRINLPGAPQTPVLENFSSFGYAIQHDGHPAEGWERYLHGANPVSGSPGLYSLTIKPKTIVSVANTVRVLSKETKACKTPPKAKAALYNLKQTEALETKIRAEIGKGVAAKVAETRVTDAQLGCDPPPLRLPCKRKECREHSPVGYIEGSRYVGDWSVVTRRKAKVTKPAGVQPIKVKPVRTQPVRTKPTAPSRTVKPAPRRTRRRLRRSKR